MNRCRFASWLLDENHADQSSGWSWKREMPKLPGIPLMQKKWGASVSGTNLQLIENTDVICNLCSLKA